MNLINKIIEIKDEDNKNIKELRFNAFHTGVKDDIISIGDIVYCSDKDISGVVINKNGSEISFEDDNENIYIKEEDKLLKIENRLSLGDYVYFLRNNKKVYAVITAISYLPSVSNYYIAVHIEDNQENSFEVLENITKWNPTVGERVLINYNDDILITTIKKIENDRIYFNETDNVSIYCCRPFIQNGSYNYLKSISTKRY